MKTCKNCGRWRKSTWMPETKGLCRLNSIETLETQTCSAWNKQHRKRIVEEMEAEQNGRAFKS